MHPGRDEFQALDRRVVLAWRLKHGAVVALVVVVAILADVVPRLVGDGRPIGPPGLLSTVAVLAGAAWVIAVPAAAYRRWRVRFTPTTIELHHGIVVRTRSTVPYFRLQHVDITRTPFDRAVGLAVLTLHTAAAATDATIPGLAEDDAERVRVHLLAHAGHDDGV